MEYIKISLGWCSIMFGDEKVRNHRAIYDWKTEYMKWIFNSSE